MKKYKKLRRVLLVAFQLICGINVLAQENPVYTTPLNYVVYKTTEPLVIDGRQAENSWNDAPWSSYFVDIEGKAKPAPQFKTRMKMLWDDQFLYIYAELEEPHIWANLKNHDQIVYHDNDFEVFIDPDGDSYQYFELEVNAFATVFDLFMSKPYRHGGLALIPYNMEGLKLAVDIDGTINDPSGIDKKWSVELAIPFKAISMGNSTQVPQDGTTWRINFSRVEWDTDIEGKKYVKKKDPDTHRPLNEHNWVWSPQGVIDMHLPERWGYIQFAGQKTTLFKMPDSEYLKYYLWSVYYKQADYIRNNGRYAERAEELGLNSNPKCGPFRCKVSIYSNPFQFFAVLQAEDSNEAWQIDQQGQIQRFVANKNQ